MYELLICMLPYRGRKFRNEHRQNIQAQSFLMKSNFKQMPRAMGLDASVMSTGIMKADTVGVSRLDQCLSNFFVAYHCHNTKHVRVPPGTENINAYFRHTGLPGCFAVGKL
jgi:hypothetical protein